MPSSGKTPAMKRMQEPYSAVRPSRNGDRMAGRWRPVEEQIPGKRRLPSRRLRQPEALQTLAELLL